MTSVSIDAPRPLEVRPGPDPKSIAVCAGLSADDIEVEGSFGHAPVHAGVGLAFLIARTNPDALACAVPNASALRALPPGPWSADPSLLLYTRDGPLIATRMFAPLAGIPEDPATGSAAAALAAFLLSLTDASEHALTISQGAQMGRPSTLHATARRTQDGIRATVGGACIPVLHGEAMLDRRIDP